MTVLLSGITQWVTATEVAVIPQAIGFTASGGTTSKTLTIDANLVASSVASKIQGSGVATITASVSAPSSPATGDLWVDLS